MIINRWDLAGYLKPGDRRGNSVDWIIVHRNTTADIWLKAHPTSSVDKVEAAFRWGRKPFSSDPEAVLPQPSRRFPYHFFIEDKDDTAQISQVHTLDTKAPHAGDIGLNHKSIGVCLCVDGRSDVPTASMDGAAIWLIGVLLRMYPHAGVRRHRPDGPYACPGSLVRVEYLEARARELALTIDKETLDSAGVQRRRCW